MSDLYNINTADSAETSLIVLHNDDNVAVARQFLSPGQVASINGALLPIREAVPAGHKVAIRLIPAGSPVRRYGEMIGQASATIEPGEHVHTANILYPDHQPQAEAAALPPPASSAAATAHFLGYDRGDGRAGTRNYIAVVAASNCAAHTTEQIAAAFANANLPEAIDGVVAFPHGEGCAHTIGPDTEQLQRTLEGIIRHPNVGAALIVGLGCEVNQISHYLPASDTSFNGSALAGLTLQSSGGTRETVAAGCRHVNELVERLASYKRTPQPASKLVLGLNCGGSDAFSGISANPALGYCSDLLVAQGGTAVLAETPEIFGAEHLLLRRARSPEVADKLIAEINGYKRYLTQFGASNFNDNPSPGNKEGGLSNIIEKSLGAVAKGGTTPLEEVVEYAGVIRQRGLVFMNTPGYDPVSLTGLAAGGVNLIAFTTGRGSAIGFPTIPVFKISSNSATFRRMEDNIDLNAGRIVDGIANVQQIGQEMFDSLLDIASGRRTRAEIMGHQEFVPWRIGPVL